MAETRFYSHDRFSFEGGYGICLNDRGRALLITGQGGRTGWKTKVGEIPKTAIVQNGEHGVPDEINLVFRAIDEILK